MRYAITCLVLLLGSTLRADDYRDLFNGKNLDGWVVEGPREFKDGDTVKPIWVVREGMLACQVKKGSFGFLRYERQEFSDFALHVEYRLAPKGNSGVGIRTVAYDPKRSTATRPSYAAYEVQIMDDAERKVDVHSTGSLYRYVAPKLNAVKPAPEWNIMDIECVGPHIKVRLNFREILDVDQSKVEAIKKKPLKGYICVQNHGSPIEFRSIRVREIRKGDSSSSK